MLRDRAEQSGVLWYFPPEAERYTVSALSGMAEGAAENSGSENWYFVLFL